MNLQELISILKSNSVTWKTVNTQPCIHTFINCYSINLCLWNNENTISVHVDDIKKGLQNIVEQDIKTGESNFEFLKDLYKKAKYSSVNLAV